MRWHYAEIIIKRNKKYQDIDTEVELDTEAPQFHRHSLFQSSPVEDWCPVVRQILEIVQISSCPFAQYPDMK